MASDKGTCSRYCFFHQLLLNSFITYERLFFLISLGVNKFQNKTTSGISYFYLDNFKPGAESEPPHKTHCFIE